MIHIFLCLLLSVASFSQNQNRNRSPQDPRARAMDFIMDNYEKFREPTFRSYQQYCTQGTTAAPNQSFCNSYQRQYGNLVTTLTNLLRPLKQGDIDEAAVATSMTCLPPGANQFTDISQLLAAIQRPCDDIPVGEFRRYPNPTTPFHNYLLQRRDANTYEATIVGNFQHLSGSVTPAQMMARANNCFQQMAPYLKSPAGQNLRIKYISPAEADSTLTSFQRPPNVDITLNAGDVRGNATTFYETFQCETIVHETLHHLGLCDEYHENDATTILPGTNPEISMARAWSCRVTPQEVTIMNEIDSSVRATVPLARTCRCKEGMPGNACRASMAAGDPVMRRILTEPPAINVFKTEVMSKCTQLNYEESEPYRARPVTRRVEVEGSGPESFVVSDAFVIPGPDGVLHGNANFFRCNCNGDATCTANYQRGVEHLSGRNPIPLAGCPTEMENASNDSFFKFQQGASLATPGQETSFTDDGFTFVTTPSNSPRPLLAPNHMSRIIYGGCTSGPAASYNRCADFAQRAVRTGNEEYCALNPGKCCDSKPAECSSDQFFLGVGAQ